MRKTINKTSEEYWTTGKKKPKKYRKQTKKE
jgi:hypothetical protein